MLKRLTFFFLYFCVHLLHAQTPGFSTYYVQELSEFSPVSGSGTKVYLGDDEVSTALPIGFEFTFFGVSYSEFYISSNGFISFSANNSNGCCSGQNIPSIDSPNNLIAFAWEDLSPGIESGSIDYFTIGEGSERRLVVNFDSVSHYGGGFEVTSQVVLYEGSGVIEIHTANMPSNDGNHTMGLENADGTLATVVKGRNQAIWSASNESIRFDPVVGNTDVGVSFISPSTNICQGNHDVIVTVQNHGSSIIDSVNINWELNGALQKSFTLYKTLYPGTSGDSSKTEVMLGSQQFNYIDQYSIKAWTSAPNGIQDSVSYNDTSRVSGNILLNGTSTIGGESPDFATFSEAIAALNNGICGPVIFNVRNGVYNEQLSINSVPGSSVINTVTFQSESEDSSKVIITNAGTSSAAYTLRVTYADNLVFKYLTFEGTNPDYAQVVHIYSGADNNVFQNNHFKGPEVTSSTQNVSLIYTSHGRPIENIFKDNFFEKGNHGIYCLEGYGTIIENNIFKDQFNRGIYLYRQSSSKILNNSVTGTVSMGMELSSCDGFEITGNRIHLEAGTGINYLNCTGGGTSANNFISVKGDGSYGMNFTSCRYQNIYHNNIHIPGTDSSQSNACRLLNSNNFQILNNIFSGRGGYALHSTGSGFTSNYNDLFTSGSNFAYFDGNNQDLASWQTASGQDSNSNQIDPLFLSDTNLHVQELALHKSAPAIPGITTDIDQDSRRSDFVCIGADEFIPYAQDGSVTEILSPKMPFAPGINPVIVGIQNAGNDTLTALTINWKINNIALPEFHWSGTLSSMEIAQVQIGTYDFSAGVPYTIEVDVTSPNGGTDPDLSNDSVSVSLISGMAGTYTIGGISPDFATIQGAVQTLTVGGAYSPVTFKIRPGIYNEGIIIPEFPGNSCDLPVTFESENGDSTSVVIAGSSGSNEVIQLNGADGFCFRKLTLESLNGNSGDVLDITNGSHCNRFENNIFRDNTQGGLVIYSGSSLDTNNTFEGNYIEGGAWGIMIQGDYGVYQPGLKIVNNIFTGQFNGGIFISDQDAPLIKGNTVTATSSSSSYYDGFFLNRFINNTQVVNNSIQTRSGRGLYLSGIDGSVTKRALVANNFISVDGSNVSIGLWSHSNANLDIFYNNVNVYGGSSRSRSFDCFHPSSDNNSVRNNIFSNRAGGYALYKESWGGEFNCDYNNLFTTGKLLVYAYEHGDLEDLSSWQAAQRSDMHSVSISPAFFSDTDLHVNKKDLDAAGIQVPGVNTDIDGELRGNPPDIGADEFTPSGANAALLELITPQPPFEAGQYPVYAVIKNSGVDNISSFSIQWNVNNTLPEKISWQGNLNYGQADTISLGMADFSVSTTYDVGAWIYSVNGSSDTDPVDDTIRVDNLRPQLSGVYTIGGDTADFNSFTDAVNVLQVAGISGTVTLKVRPGTYTEQLTLNNIPGSGCENQVIFEAENADSSSVIVSHYSSYNYNYVVQLDGADGIHFRKLSFESLNRDYHTVLDIRNESHCNIFEGNVLKAPASTSSYNSSAIINSPATNDTNNIIIGNKIEGGSIGINMVGPHSKVETGLKILNNTISGQYRYGVLLQYLNSPVASGNIVRSESGYYTYVGMNVINCKLNVRVVENRIQCSAGTALGLKDNGISWTENLIVANNFISIGLWRETVTGIFSEYNSGLTIAHNNVQIHQGNTSSRAYHNSGSNDIVRNNIFSNKTGGYAIYNSYPSLNSNYNDLYTRGTYLAYYNGNRTNLSAWQSAGSWDQNSISVDPLFVSDYDLHVGQAQLSSAGTPISGITTDIDGELRGSFPDIGADEFLLNNAVFAELLTPALPFVSGTYPVQAVIKNTGAEDLTSLKLHWSVNDTIQPELSWQGVISTGQSDTIALGSVDFTTNVKYNFIAWIDSINGSYDDHPMDDTIRVNSIYSALPAGVYTIGPDSATFPSFTQAAEALNSGGVLGSVIFKVQPGTYIEKLKLNSIPGAGCDNKIIFESQNGDSTSVVLRSSSFYTPDSNYVVQLDGADGIHFRKLTFQVSSSFSRVLDLRNGSDCNFFENNVFLAPTSTSITDRAAVIYSSSSIDNYNVFEGNSIEGGCYGIYLEGSSFSREVGLEISNNIISDTYFRGISLWYQNYLINKGNIITTTKGAGNYFGISVANSYRPAITNNRIVGENLYSLHEQHLKKGGILLTSNYGAGIIANNFIAVGGTNAVIGISSDNNLHLQIFHNSVNILKGISSRAFESTDGSNSNVLIRNNIFSNKAGGYAIYCPSSDLINSDYNNLYTTGSSLAYYNGENREDLLSWHTAANSDSNSISADPFYVSDFDLHASSLALIEAGTPLGIIDADIDGDIRDTLRPDIGADEFSMALADAGILEINAPEKPFVAGAHAIDVKLFNKASALLDSVTVNWTVNNQLQTPVNWKGSLEPGKTATVNLGSVDFKFNTAHNIAVWTSGPNGTADEVPENDSAYIHDLYVALNGTYIIGKDSVSSFNSFTESVHNLKQGGVLGPVIFLVKNGTYNEQISIPEITGTTSENTITYTSESSDSSMVVLTHEAESYKNYTIELNGADYISFTGLTIRAASRFYSRAISLQKETHDITLRQNKIEAPASENSPIKQALVFSEVGGNGNVFIHDNFFQGGSHGIYLAGNYLNYDTAVVISENIFQGQAYKGIFLQYSIAPLVTKNVFSHTGSASYGIHLKQCSNNLRISKNEINATPYEHTGYSAIYLDQNSINSSTRAGIIDNNFLVVKGAGAGNGISIYNSKYQHLFFNNILCARTNASSAALYVHGNDNRIRLINNIFANSGGGYAAYVNSLAAIEQSNYNNIFSSGPTLGYLGADIQDITEWQVASSQDAQSLSVDPLFISGNDLHVRQPALDGAGIPVTGISPGLMDTDFDGDTRDSLRPDIGADEFRLALADAGITEIKAPAKIFPEGESPVVVNLLNMAGNALDSVTINWKINNEVQTPFNWKGLLETGKNADISIGIFNAKINTSYTITAWTSDPDGIADEYPSNDSAYVKDLYAALHGTYTIGKDSSSSFNSFTESVNNLKKGGVLGPVNFIVKPGEYREQISIPEIAGVSSVNTIAYTSESSDSTKAVLTFFANASANYTVELNGVDYISFAGLTIRAEGSAYSRAVWIHKEAHNISFERNRIEGTVSADKNSSQALVFSEGDGDNSIYLHNNFFKAGSYGIFLSGSSLNYDSAVVILENVFENQTYNGIFLQYQEVPSITKNTLSSSSTRSDYSGIYLTECKNNLKISQNEINTGAGRYGIYLGGITADNSINVGIIDNNFVLIKGAGLSNGIQISNSKDQNIYYNTIICASTNVSGSSIAVSDADSRVRLINNIFANSGGGYAAHINSVTAIEQSNHNNLFTSGSILGYLGADVLNLTEWQVASSQDAQSLSVDPLFIKESDFHVRQPLLDGAGIPVAGIETDIDGDLRNASTPDIGADEFIAIAHDLSLISLLSPQTSCGLDSAENITVRILNYGAESQTGFDIIYVHNADTIIENVGALIVPSGETVDFTFTTKADMSALGEHTFSLYSTLPADENLSNDSLKNIVVTHYKQLDTPVSNMLPYDGTINLSPPIAFSWTPVEHAGYFDLYVWNATGSKPANPTVGGITQIHYNFKDALSYGASYNWQIVARNTCSEIAGPEQIFTLRELPDIIVSDVQVPASAYSGQSFDVSWHVKNIGTGSTTSFQWIDAVYRSEDDILDYSVDAYLGGVSNFSSLNPDQEYAQTASFTMPEGISGDYYLFVVTDRFNRMPEGNESNNLTKSVTPIRITLTPPPNLEVESIIKPNNAFSGQTAEVSWTVRNTGSGATRTGVWYDQVYLASDSLFSADAISLGRFKHTGILPSDSGYTQTATIAIPHEVFGNYYFIVRTDDKDQIYEHAFDMDNTTISSPVNIILLPPPDHLVTSISAPSSASNNEKIIVEWTVENQGGTTTTASGWVDAVYISDVSDLSLANARSLGSITRSDQIAPGDAYHTTKEVSIPSDFVGGDYYIYVKTDIGNKVYEYQLEGNNVSANDSTLKILNPDLVVSAVRSDSLGLSGQQVSLQWLVKNKGNGQVYSTEWIDYIYGSSFGTFHIDSVIKLDSLIYTSSVLPADSMEKNKSVKLPNGISGNYYLYLHTDVKNKVFEGENEGNNITGSNPVAVSLSPWADLQVKSIQVKDSLRAGDFVNLEYTITNLGQTVTELSSWNDKVYLSEDSVWTESDILIQSIDRSLPLLVDSSYSVKVSVQIPATLSSGSYYLFVFADGDNVVYEHSDETNNINAAHSVFIKPYPPIDLAVASAVFTGEPASGNQVTVSWMVRNLGEGTTIAGRWNDAVYLSSDGTWDVEDILLSKFTQERVVKAGESYQENNKVTIPNGVSGSHYLLAVTDIEYANPDDALVNNYLAAADTTDGGSGTGGGAINISLTPPADLVVTNFAAPPQAISGQPINLSWTVSNNGEGTTIQSSWTDKVYLSTDNTIDRNDLLLGSFVSSGNLPVGASYTAAKEFTIPVYYSGNYILIVMTDNNNAEYEHTGENNNIKTASVAVERPAASDLIVSEVSVPANAVAGTQVALSWKTKNIGSNPSTGKMKEAVFLSLDTLWDIKDVLIGTFDANINLAPQAEFVKNVSADWPAVPLGDYYLLVQTDILNNIFELSDSNNIRSSPEHMQVSVPELPLNVITPAVLANKKSKYYKIIVPAELAGESLLITLDGDSVNGNNELYVRHGEVPTRVLYDYAHDLPFQGNQEIVIPELTEGTYYLLVHGSTTSGVSQQINLFAKILNFEIRSVNASKGGNTGAVTIELKGSKFEPGMIVKLVQSADTLVADTLRYMDPTRSYATFNLKGSSLGHYDVMAINSKNEEAKLSKGFEIIQGGPSNLITNIINPSNTRPGRVVAVTIEFSNGGDADIINPEVVLESGGGTPVGFKVDELTEGKTELRIPLQELGGPVGILRPGAIGSITVYSKATGALAFIVKIKK